MKSRIDFIKMILFGISLGLAIPTTFAAPSVQPSQLSQDTPSLPTFDLNLTQTPMSSSQLQGQTPAQIQVGDEIQLKITGIQIPGISNPAQELILATPTSPDSSLEDQGWAIGRRKADSQSSPNEIELTAIPLKPGKLTLPSLGLKDSKGNLVGRTQPFSIEVVSAISAGDPKPQQPEALEPPVSLAFPWWIIAILIILGILGVGVLSYLVYEWRKNRRSHLPEPPKIIRPEDEVALEDLLGLEKRGLLLQGQFKAHYFKVSEIMKAYVGSRYRFDALESTTDEMLDFLESRKSLEDTVIDALEVLFHQLDRVKFTDHFPAEEESSQIIPKAREFIYRTRRVPTVQSVTQSSSSVTPKAGAEPHAL